MPHKAFCSIHKIRRRRTPSFAFLNVQKNGCQLAIDLTTSREKEDEAVLW